MNEICDHGDHDHNLSSFYPSFYACLCYDCDLPCRIDDDLSFILFTYPFSFSSFCRDLYACAIYFLSSSFCDRFHAPFSTFLCDVPSLSLFLFPRAFRAPLELQPSLLKHSLIEKWRVACSFPFLCQYFAERFQV